jgi:uncharacterized membrane protein (UPF0182 family)
MESLIAQNRDISKQITLWNTNGSKVIMGNLLVIPLQDSLLYIEPVYLQASNNPCRSSRKSSSARRRRSSRLGRHRPARLLQAHPRCPLR